MATQIYGSDHILLFPRPADVSQQTGWDDTREREERGNVFRGFFYAVLFNLFLLLTSAAGWVLWRIVR
jgi:hypothetical protein